MIPDPEALAAFLAKEQPKIDARREKVKNKRKRDEELFQRHTKTYLDMNFSWLDNNGIRQYQFPYWAVHNELPPVPSGEDPQVWAKRQGGQRNAMGRRAGVVDWHMLMDGKYRVIELKVPGGRISDSQKQFMYEISRHGGETHVAWNMNEFHAIISSWCKVKYPPAACDSRSKKLMTQQAVAHEMLRRD